MGYVDESQAKGLVKRIFRSFRASNLGNKLVMNTGFSHRKFCKKTVAHCRDDSSAQLIEERYSKTNKCELVWGKWCLSGAFTDDLDYKNFENYNQISFSINYFTSENYYYGIYYINISQHSMLKLIMRSGKSIKNGHELLLYLKSITKELVLSSLRLANNVILNNGHEDGYVIIDKMFIPLAFNTNFCDDINHPDYALGCTVITVMPDHYDSAVKEFEIRDPIKPIKSIFETPKLLESLIPFAIIDE
jgi:hypothetical protein